MGLPLYVAPVESDLRPRPVPKSPPAHPRSAIRRRRQQHSSFVEARRRAGIAAYIVASRDQDATQQSRHPRQGPASSDLRDDNAASLSGGTGDNSSTAASGWASASSRPRDTQPETAYRRSTMLPTERELNSMSERWANLHNNSSNPEPANLRINPLRPMPDGEYRVIRSPLEGPPNATTLTQATTTRRRQPRRRDDSLELPPIRQEVRVVVEPSHTLEPQVSSSRQRSARMSRLISRRDAAPVDGLGDRNRSVSPEAADNPWYTIVSTVTPDPQPPSLGSSFASATASMSTSMTQSSTGEGSSSATSMSGGGRPEEPEQQCDSGCENSDTEGEDEDDTPPESIFGWIRRRQDEGRDARMAQFARAVHSYADIAADRPRLSRSHVDISGDSVDRANSGAASVDSPSEFMIEMQRIVHRLATREDIPDEWWAEVGLSRTLSRVSR